MDISPVIPAGRQLIKGYGDGGFTIAGIRWDGSVLVFPDQTVAWTAKSLSEVSLDGLAPVVEAGPDLLLLGTGAVHGVLPPALKMAFRSAGLRVEVMDTGAACRTFNVLLAEDRRVAAALIAV